MTRNGGPPSPAGPPLHRLHECAVWGGAFAAVFTFLLTAGAGWVAHAQVRSPFPWLPSNFDTTVNGNFRGARITSRDQLDSMRRFYGITAVLNLAKDALPLTGPNEIHWSKELGLEYVGVYLGSSPPSNEQWARIRAMLARGGVYVHCAHGADRTGAIIAKYRIETEGMDPCDAYREARRYGFKPYLKKFRAWIGCPER